MTLCSWIIHLVEGFEFLLILMYTCTHFIIYKKFVWPERIGEVSVSSICVLYLQNYRMNFDFGAPCKRLLS